MSRTNTTPFINRTKLQAHSKPVTHTAKQKRRELQDEPITFVNTYSDIKSGRVIIAASDGSLIAAGEGDDNNIHIIKVGSDKTSKWELHLDGENQDVPNKGFEDSDGNFVISAKVKSTLTGNFDAATIKVSPNGVLLNHVAACGEEYDDFNDVIPLEGPLPVELAEAKYVALGSTTSAGERQGLNLAYLDYDLLPIDSYYIGGLDSTWTGASLTQLGDVLRLEGDVDHKSSSIYANCFSLALFLNNTIKSTDTFGGIFTDGIFKTRGNLSVGRTNGFGQGGYDGLVVSRDDSGTLTSAKTIGTIHDDKIVAGKPTSDGGHIFAIENYDFGGQYKTITVLKTDDTFIEEWSVSLHDSGGNSQKSTPADIDETPSGGFALTGEVETSADYYGALAIAEISSNGTLTDCTDSFTVSDPDYTLVIEDITDSLPQALVYPYIQELSLLTKDGTFLTGTKITPSESAICEADVEPSDETSTTLAVLSTAGSTTLGPTAGSTTTILGGLTTTTRQADTGVTSSFRAASTTLALSTTTSALGQIAASNDVGIIAGSVVAVVVVIAVVVVAVVVVRQRAQIQKELQETQRREQEAEVQRPAASNLPVAEPLSMVVTALPAGDVFQNDPNIQTAIKIDPRQAQDSSEIQFGEERN